MVMRNTVIEDTHFVGHIGVSDLYSAVELNTETIG